VKTLPIFGWWNIKCKSSYICILGKTSDGAINDKEKDNHDEIVHNVHIQLIEWKNKNLVLDFFIIIMELDESCFHPMSNGCKSATFQRWKL